MAMEIEDDVFFADLSRQISLLIMDDDEEFPVKSPPVHLQGLSYMQQQAMMPPAYTYEMAYRRESKGTGVFIPRLLSSSSSIPRRKNRSTRLTSTCGNPPHKQQQQLEKSGSTVTPVSGGSTKSRTTS